MDHIFLDLECTCWKFNHVRANMETIEIGAVRVNSNYEVVDQFNAFVRPQLHPTLSSFCTKLTSIQQKDVDQAADFRTVFKQLTTWAGINPFIWYSWGEFDREQLNLDLGRHQLNWGENFSETNYINLKSTFARWQGLSRPVGMMKALRSINIPFEGRHHRAIDDAQHVAKIAAYIHQLNGS